MLTDIWTVMWKEWREVLRMGGRRRRALLRLIISIGALGVIWPWQLGPQFITGPVGVLLAAFTSAMYVAGVVPDSFAGERERHTLETLLASRLPDRAILFGKVTALITYGMGAAGIMLLFGWATVNAVHRADGILFYRPSAFAAAIAFSLVAAGFMGAIGVLVSLRAATVKQAQQVLSTLVLLLLFAPVIALPAIPPSWRDTALRSVQEWGVARAALVLGLGLVLVQGILYGIAAGRFKRARLIVEQ
jgi:ABC-2 type transport system permease protein